MILAAALSGLTTCVYFGMMCSSWPRQATGKALLDMRVADKDDQVN